MARIKHLCIYFIIMEFIILFVSTTCPIIVSADGFEVVTTDINVENNIDDFQNEFDEDLIDSCSENSVSSLDLESNKYEDTELLTVDHIESNTDDILEDKNMVMYSQFDDVLETDIPPEGSIPDGIWIAGVEDLEYTGKQLKQDFRVYDGTTMLKQNVDYNVSYRNNQKVFMIVDLDNLTAEEEKYAPRMIISMKGNYSGKDTIYFSIKPPVSSEEKPTKITSEPYPITGDKISITDKYGNTDLTATYSKSGAKPEIRIMYEDMMLKEGRDYILKYSGNTYYPARKAFVTIIGKGDFNKSVKKHFAVNARTFSKDSGITVIAYDRVVGKKAGQYKTTIKVLDSEGKLLKKGTDYENNIVYIKDGKELTTKDFPKAGDTITVSLKGKGGYTSTSIETSYDILPLGKNNKLENANIKIKPQLYNKGKDVTITSQDQFQTAFIGSNHTPLTLSTDDGVTGDFMVVPESYVNNIKKGTAKVTIMGINGQTGIKTISYRIEAKPIGKIKVYPFSYSRTKITVLSYNVAHYKLGENYINDEAIENFKKLIQIINPDVAIISEDDIYLDSLAEKNADQYLYDPFFLETYTFFGTSIKSKYPLFDTGTFYVLGNSYRPCRYGKVTVDDKTIFLASIHFSIDREASETETGESLRLDQLTKLYNYARNCGADYIIIAGDTNAYTDIDRSNYIEFCKDHDMYMANGGYLGWKITTPDGQAIDNILVSNNIIINRFRVHNDWYPLLFSDHYPVSAELILL